MDRRQCMQLLGLGGALSLAGCTTSRSASTDAGAVGDTLRLATATTVHDSGLLDAVVPGFEQLFGAKVAPIVRGSGGALRTAQDGDCDLVLVHARPLEDDFLRAGHGVNRRSLMVNDFLVVGPAEDPAGIAELGPIDAFQVIAETEAPFLSRGDRSGTHLRERQLWQAAGIDPGGAWYSESGQGMGRTLVLAAETGAYTLTDRGTFRNVADDTLVAHVAAGIEDPPPLLRNEYAVIPVNPARHDVAYPLAMAFVGYLTGPGHARIDAFRVDGEQVFRSLSPAPEPDFTQYVPTDWTRPESS